MGKTLGSLPMPNTYILPRLSFSIIFSDYLFLSISQIPLLEKMLFFWLFGLPRDNSIQHFEASDHPIDRTILYPLALTLVSAIHPCHSNNIPASYNHPWERCYCCEMIEIDKEAWMKPWGTGMPTAAWRERSLDRWWGENRMKLEKLALQRKWDVSFSFSLDAGLSINTEVSLSPVSHLYQLSKG